MVFAGHYNAMDAAMEQLYGSSLITLAKGDSGAQEEFDRAIFEQAAEWVRENGGFSPKMLKEKPAQKVIKEIARVIQSAIASSISHETPETMRATLENNAFIFSGFKTYHSLSEVGLRLTDKEGNAKSYVDFKADVLAVDEKYNQNYLRAEYDHAVHSSQMASKWNDFEQDGDRYNLQYRTAGDDKVRADHAALRDITLPVDDPFWGEYMPPNGWGCRCNVVQVRKQSFTQSDSAEAIKAGEQATSTPKEKMFRYNPGKELEVFPPKHPYYKAPAEVSEVLLAKVSKAEYTLLEKDSSYRTSLRLIRDLFTGEAKELSDFEKAAIHYYSREGYIDINKLARKQFEPSNETHKKVLVAVTKVLSNALKKKEARFEGKVLRGAKLMPAQISEYKKHLKNDKPIKEIAFLSTTSDSEFVFGGNVLYKIKSTRGVKIDDLSSYTRENEVLFDRNTEFKVINVKTDDKGGATIELEEI